MQNNYETDFNFEWAQRKETTFLVFKTKTVASSTGKLVSAFFSTIEISMLCADIEKTEAIKNKRQ
jgi:hypothetical protein